MDYFAVRKCKTLKKEAKGICDTCLYVCMYVCMLKTSITTRCRIDGVRTNRRARRRAWEAEACTETPVKILLEKVKC